jgi:nucleotide-binding universal stress UspA family protein
MGDDMYKQILCPVDGSETSNCGMVEAINLAKSIHAKVRFLYIVDTFHPMLDGMEVGNMTEIINGLREHGKAMLEQTKASALAQGVEADTVILENDLNRVSTIIVTHAKEWPADLILMGTHGRRGLSHLLMGSDAEAVIRTSPVPVLTVRLN